MSDLIIGTIIGLLSSAFFAIQNVLIGGEKEEVNALIANSIKMWVAFPLMLVLVILPWRAHDFLLPQSVMLPLIISILLGGAFGDAIYLSSQERIGVSRAFPIANTYPIITYMVALLMLDEVLRITTITGIILAIIGVVLVSRELEPEESEEETLPYDWRGLALAFISSIMTLEPGDLVLTGTPAGVSTLSPGDEVTVEIEGIGSLTNPVREDNRSK